MGALSHGPGFTLAGAGLALGAWTAERAGLKLPDWLLIPVGAVAGLLFFGGLALIARDHWPSRRKVPDGLRDEIATIQRELIRRDNRRQINGGSIWPIERPYRDLPTEQWRAAESRVRLNDADRKAISTAYALAARFNDEMLRGETVIASAQEPDLEGLRRAFDVAAEALDLPAMARVKDRTAQKAAPELSFGRVQIPRHPREMVLDPDALIHPRARVLRVPVINAQGAATATSVQALITFRPDDETGWMSPRDPALAEWDTEPPTTSVDIPGNGQPQLFDVALVLDEAYPCVFQWTRHSRAVNLEGYGIAGQAIIKVEVRGAGPEGTAPSATDTLHIEALEGSLCAQWESEGLGTRRNCAPWRDPPMIGPPPGSGGAI